MINKYEQVFYTARKSQVPQVRTAASEIEDFLVCPLQSVTNKVCGYGAGNIYFCLEDLSAPS